MSATIYTVHNASGCKQPPNAENKFSGSRPFVVSMNKKRTTKLVCVFVGGDNRTRTCDPSHVKRMLYQLSHASK